MLGVRRTVAIVLFLPLTLLVFIALAACRVDATILDDGYLREVARDTDVFGETYDDLVTVWVDGYVEDQESLPDRIEAMGLPRDTDARARMAELVRSLVPQQTFERSGDQAFSVIPWLVGKRDTFEIRISLRDGVLNTFGHEPDRSSLFEQAWLDVGMGERMVNGFIARALDPPVPDAGRPADREPLTLEESTALDDLLATRLSAAGAWWDTQLFAIIDAMLPYLVGDSSTFEARIDFAEFPELATAFSDMLGEDVELLRRDGFIFTQEELIDRLRESRDATVADVDESLAIFRAEGMTFDQDDFIRRMDEQRLRNGQLSGEIAEGLPPDVTAESSPGMQVADLRDRVSTGRLVLRWGTMVAAALLVAAISMLAGYRTWPSRFAWGAAAVLASSSVGFLIATATRSVLLDARLNHWVEEQTIEAANSPGDIARARAAELLERAIGDIVGGMQTYALGGLALSMITLGLAILWPRPAFQQAIRRFRGDTPPSDAPVA